ncbi:META domain-containing protein [Beijerinckia indica]|uniref:DUF306 domain-containing protein n=1 Tax=Beijerinckia indica subsp. indica (strain ATCC 9039 / DSM 1715 / NCIMB 8712) TaxID=395963 RepID=B2IJM3_BEII9|nr:META domain-containing protein [Beijerinckia indica]ACB94895.1 protein of unknown function DUF306 Meta and HslJ [Beijerinckia indica subsp. indica ATCC 9039]
MLREEKESVLSRRALWVGLAVSWLLMGAFLAKLSAEPAQGSLIGRWLAEDILGGGVIDRLQSVLEIAADGTVSGSGGCNRMRGHATIDGEKLSFGPLITTRMACSPAVMDQEGKFLASLEKVRSFRIDNAQRKLILFDDAGNRILVLAALS